MPIPQIILPCPFAKLGKTLPATPPRWALVQMFNLLLKRGVLPADMSLLAGRHFEVDVLDAGLTLRFTATEKKFCLDDFTGEPDLRFAANTVEFAKMLLREEDPDTLFFNRKLQIEGDTELGLIVKNLLDSIDWSNTPISRLIRV